MSKTVGDYQLKDKIGKGSYADVYRGTHKVTGVKYAIKAISKDILSEPKLLAGLESEIKIMREFSHENIVGLHEYFSSEKNFYLVLELCEGGDLSKFIKKRKRLDERLAHKFLAQITSGLAFLHEKDFIHRDLKPANVLLSEFSDNAILKLADFGFARQLTVASLAQTRCGTPLYMAPEILESKDYDGKADIWSVGCIFYEMLVGTSPFKGTNEGDLLVNIKTKELNVPKEIVLSKVSIEILIKLLERHPIRRASLNQLVVLTSHLSNVLPPVASSAVPEEEEGMALPVPSLNERAVHQQQQGSNMQSSARRAPEMTTTPEAPQSRRRYSSTAVPSDARMPDGMDPNFMSPAKGPSSRGYAGGPAPSNLQGMFSPVQTPSTDSFSPSHGGSIHATGVRDGYSNRRYSASAATVVQQQQSDPSISKTLRAPYVHTSAANKYPSPSSSPPGGGMSVVSGGFLQGSNARAQNSQVAQQASSPAATAISMVGNFIANVFNPVPSPTAGAMSESARGYQHQQQRNATNNAQHGRTVSLDRGATTNYYNNTGTNTGYFTGGGGGGPNTPPNTHNNKARSAQQVIHGRGTIREDHFAADSDGIVRDNSGSLTMDDDFVMISNTQSASEGDRKLKDREGGDNSVPTRSAVVSANNSGANSNNNSGVVMATTPTAVRNNVVTTAEYDMESDALANETAAIQAFYASIVQRCEVYCAVVSAISSLGDQYVREIPVIPAQNKAQKNSFGQGAMPSTESDDEEEGIAGFLQPNQDAILYPHKTTQISVERYLIACSLYLHALSILTRLMKSFESNTGVDQPENMKTAMQKLKADLSTVFEQLIARAESCQKHIDTVVNTDAAAGMGPSSTLSPKYAMPRPEPVMIQAALRRESDATLEEMLGNLNLACKLYLSANELVEGVTLTANDPEDQRKLRVYSTSLLDKHATCKKRAAELMIYS